MKFTNSINAQGATQNKRPIIVTIFAILVLLSIPGDLFKAITINKEKYTKEIKWVETLMQDGSNRSHNKIIYWKDKSEFQKQLIVSRLNLQKKIFSAFSLYRIFEYLFVGLNLFLFYALWKMKRWILIVLIPTILTVASFNLIFIIPFKSLFAIIIYVIPIPIIIALFYKFFQKRFIF